jgi:ribose-phosphate pyrophosphokinase
MALQEIQNLGVDNIITFDAHDPKVQNAVPLIGFENIYPTYQIIKALLRSERNLEIDREKMLVVSPDAGGMNRNIYFANVLGLDVGMFYKRRDLTKIVDGRNPIVAHQYLGVDVEGKDILITDDMLDSGESVLDVAKELKKRKANRIYVAVTFGLFTSGVQKFDEYYRDGIITKVFSTNLTYRREELKNAPWYVEVDMSKYISYIIEALNHDESISLLLNPTTKISILLDKYKRERQKL